MPCRRDNTSACDARLQAVRAGLCWFSWEATSWFVIRDGVPTLATTCPYCGGVLPTLVDSILRALSDREDE